MTPGVISLLVTADLQSLVKTTGTSEVMQLTFNKPLKNCQEFIMEEVITGLDQVFHALESNIV